MPSRLRLLCLVSALATCAAAAAMPSDPTPASNTRPIRIMAVGDSITEGADFFRCYRFPLWEKLFGAGYLIEYVGTRSAPSRIGPLAHEGYGGKNTEYLADVVPEHFAAHPADIVLLHSGHNHSIEEKPVAGIVAATERLIASFRKTNPHVTVLLAQVIPAGKLPKYAYLPELNAALAELARRLDAPQQRVVLVDQATGFDWSTDTVADKVHPNARGAEKMAERWFAALKTVLPPPARSFSPRRVTYKTVGDTALQLHVFEPPADRRPDSARGRPAIVFFFGGGWVQGTPIQFYPECAHFADRGYIAFSADYRLASAGGPAPLDCADDARDAVRWVRDHAAGLGIDPTRVTAAGASAGGHLAALTALRPSGPLPPRAEGPDGGPDALVLWYPVLDTRNDRFGGGAFGSQQAELSPLHLLEMRQRALPPTLILVGSADSIAPEAAARAFQETAHRFGSRCDLVVYPGGGHPLYAYREGGGPLREATLAEADRFLDSLAAPGTPGH